MSDPTDDFRNENPDFRICEGCEGEFYYGDLADGSLCHDCYEAAFGDDDE